VPYSLSQLLSDGQLILDNMSGTRPVGRYVLALGMSDGRGKLVNLRALYSGEGDVTDDVGRLDAGVQVRALGEFLSLLSLKKLVWPNLSIIRGEFIVVRRRSGIGLGDPNEV